MNIKDVIERISYFRTKRNLSARELSLIIGKSESYINRLESIGFNIPITIVLDIIKVLDVKPEEFFSSNYQNYSVDHELSELLKSLPKDKKQHIINFIKQ